MKILFNEITVLNHPNKQLFPETHFRMFSVQIYDETGKMTNPYDGTTAFKSLNVFSGDTLFKCGKKWVLQHHGMPHFVFDHLGFVINYIFNTTGVQPIFQFLPLKTFVV